MASRSLEMLGLFGRAACLHCQLCGVVWCVAPCATSRHLALGFPYGGTFVLRYGGYAT